MNIYEKLQEARNIISKAEIKKSGENKFAKYTYYELADFLPTILKICTDLKMTTCISFFEENAVLTIVDLEKSDDKIIFESPMVESELKGCTKIQALGAVQTYQRRYLYMTAFEIIESDTNDKVTHDLSAHNIFSIKQRIEELMTEKMKNGLKMEDLAKSMKVKESDIQRVMGYFPSINNLELALKKL